MNNTKNEDSETVGMNEASHGQGDGGFGLTPAIQDDIGRRLRGLYGQLTAEPLPDRFVKLLSELSTSDKSGTEHSE